MFFVQISEGRILRVTEQNELSKQNFIYKQIRI